MRLVGSPLHRGLVRGSFPAPHHHDPNKTLPNFQIWVMVVFPSPNTAGERLRDQRFLRAGVRLRYQRIQTLRRPCYRLLRHRSMLGSGACFSDRAQCSRRTVKIHEVWFIHRIVEVLVVMPRPARSKQCSYVTLLA